MVESTNDTTNAVEIAHQLRIIQDQLAERTNMSEDHRARMELIVDYFISQIAISYER